jgi:DNA-binding response OmpR family regulator
VPVRRKPSAADVPQRHILLLEEYGALAAAISSALKKFAPGHSIVVTRSLAEAEKLASDLDPELFVLDVDPPWAGLTNFLEKLRADHPKARALVIGTAIPSEIATERGSSGGLQFIEKPFDLAAFGAAVQALLGPWREQDGRGNLGALNLIDVLLAHCAAGSSIALDLRSGTRTGEIHIGGGQILHAETGRLRGEDALQQILNWSKPRLNEQKSFGASPRTVPNWQMIVLEALREATPELPEPRRGRPEIERPRAGKRIVVVDDTEMLLIFVEDILATADPELQITTAINATDGLRKIEGIIPDLVLLDYSLPDFNGDQLCELLLENQRTARVPILMMSGHVPEMEAAAARLSNIVATIEKPFLSDAFVDLVRRTLETEHTFEKQIEEAPLEPAISELEAPPAPLPPLPEKEIVPEPPRRATAPTTLAPIERHIDQRAPAAVAPTIRVAPTDGNAAVIGIFLEVLSMQLTSQLQMGAIRARPTSLMASLRLESATARSAIPSQLGFQLGPTKLNADGRISTLRLVPTSKPIQPAQMRTAFEIGGIAMIPNETRARVQLTPAGTTPMTMELIAHLELDAVELSPSFQVAQLILSWTTSAVRVTLNPKAPEQTAAKFEMRVAKLDDSNRIAEVLLSPIK